MKTFVQHGNTLALFAPYAVASGAPFQVGHIVAVAVNAAESGGAIEGMRKGVFEVPKATGQQWAVGDRIYWNDTTKVMTMTASGNKLVGAAVEYADTPATTGVVLLDGAIR